MIQKVILNPSITITDPFWISLIAYVQKNPYCKFKELDFREGKPFGGIQEEQLNGYKVEKSVRF
jgi:hypothetical protein